MERKKFLGIFFWSGSFFRLSKDQYKYPSLFAGVTFLKNFIREYRNRYFKPKTSKNCLKRAVFPRYSWFLNPRIVKTANTKTANSEGLQYFIVFIFMHYTVHCYFYKYWNFTPSTQLLLSCCLTGRKTRPKSCKSLRFH